MTLIVHEEGSRSMLPHLHQVCHESVLMKTGVLSKLKRLACLQFDMEIIENPKEPNNGSGFGKWLRNSSPVRVNWVKSFCVAQQLVRCTDISELYRQCKSMQVCSPRDQCLALHTLHLGKDVERFWPASFSKSLINVGKIYCVNSSKYKN